jgi:hypothetical protein
MRKKTSPHQPASRRPKEGSRLTHSMRRGTYGRPCLGAVSLRPGVAFGKERRGCVSLAPVTMHSDPLISLQVPLQSPLEGLRGLFHLRTLALPHSGKRRSIGRPVRLVPSKRVRDAKKSPQCRQKKASSECASMTPDHEVTVPAPGHS